MAGACASCSGMGFVEQGDPCPACGTSPEDARHAYEVAQATAKAAPKATLQWVDQVGKSKAGDTGQSPEEAGFSSAQIAQQAAADLAAMARER